jgi:hypothetical protein
VLSLDELNPVTDPPAHFYENANNTPWTTAPGQLDESDFPYYMRFGQDGTRSRRLRELLTPASGLTLADVDEIAFDDKIEFAPALIDLLDQAVLRPGSSTEATEVADVLDEWGADWGFEADPDSTQFVLFIAWVRALDKQALGFNPQQASADYPEGLVGQPGGATTAQLDEVARAAEAAYEQMMQSPGPGSLTVRTGDLHTMDWGDFHGPIGGGTQDAPAVHMTGCKNAYPASRLVAFPCSAANGSSYMMDVDFADGAMHTARPVSASDDPASPFYTKNAEDYAAARFRAFPLSPAAVAAARTSQLDLVYDPDPKPDEPPRRTHAKLGNVRAAKHLRAHGWVELRFRCGAPAGERCRGSLRIEVRSRALKRNGHRGHDRAGKGTTTVARRHYSLAPGSRKLRVRIDRRARRAVRRHKLNATARWTIAQPQGGEQEGRERLVLRRPKR